MMADKSKSQRTEHDSRHGILPTLGIVFVALILFIVSIFHGSVDIPSDDVITILAGKDDNPAWRYIIIYSRLPQALTALLAGGALSVSGLLLQTFFRNPLAAPDIFGVTSGASLAVALLMLAPGLVAGSALSYVSSVVAAFIGAMAVTLLIWIFSRRVRSSVILIIIGIMVGYICSSAITLLNAMATEEGVRNFVVWGMGNFSSVGMDSMPLFAVVTVLATMATFLLVKPLNALLLGTQYAESLGIRVRRMRNILLSLTCLLTAVVTAFCGPIAFLALAVPHLARLVIKTSDHRRLLPMTIAMGSAIALMCNIVTTLPHDGTILPLNAVTPLVGAPVIIYVVMRRRW